MSKLMNYIINWLPRACYLLRDEFTIAEAAPLGSPRICRPGPGQLILDQTDGQFSIVNGEFVFPGQATPVWGDQDWYALDNAGAAYARALGRVLKARNVLTAGANSWIGFCNDNTPGAHSAVDAEAVCHAAALTAMRCCTTGQDNFNLRDALPGATNYWQCAVVLSPYTDTPNHWYPNTPNDHSGANGYGAHYFFRDESGDDSWRLVWYRQLGNTAILYPAFSNYNSAGRRDYVRIPCDDTDIWHPLLTPIAYDEFTDANGVTLPNHTMTYGGYSWVNDIGVWQITGNQADPDATANALCYVPTVKCDIWAEANVYLATANRRTGIVTRGSADTSGGVNHWECVIYAGVAGNDTTIYELSDGVFTNRGTADTDLWSIDNTYNIRVRHDDLQITMYVDYVERLHYATAWFNRHATWHGMTTTAHDNSRWDNFILLPRGTGLERIAYDSFTDPNGTSLDAHTMDEGGLAWVESVGDWDIQGNEADPDNNANATAYTPSTVANKWVTARVLLATSGAWAGIVARKSADTGGGENHWEFRLRGTFVGQDTILADINNGVSTTRGIADNDWLLTRYYLDMYCDGQTITCYVDGTQVLTFAIATFNETATWAGLVTGSAHTNARFDQFRVTEIPALGEYDTALDSF